MKLTTRISLFFLVALALVLIGMSTSIYYLVRTHQLHRLDEQMTAALGELTAAVEFGSDGLEWESADRQFAFGYPASDVPLAWSVVDPAGQQLDWSRQNALPFMENPLPSSEDRAIVEKEWNGDSWHIVRQIIRSTSYNPADGPIHDEPDVKRYRALIMSVGAPINRVLFPLRTLAISLAALSATIWMISALGGHWLAAKSVSPLTQMAANARTISAADLSRRLSPVKTGDELEDLNRAFNDLLTRVQESFERQKRFAAEASHQLRTPLTAMLGQIDVALRRGRDADEYRTTLEAAQRQGTRLRQIVEGLLFLTREDRDAAVPALETVDLHSWLTEHLQSWEQHPRHIDVHFIGNNNGPVWAKIQPLLLGEAIDNLLDNACKYSESGSPITVKLEAAPDTVFIVVEDCGVGIGAADLPHLFEPFFRSAAVRECGIGGVGLGLAVVRRIVTVFNGQVTVDSTLGQGSCLTIKLPRSVQPAPTTTPLLESSNK